MLCNIFAIIAEISFNLFGEPVFGSDKYCKLLAVLRLGIIEIQPLKVKYPTVSDMS